MAFYTARELAEHINVASTYIRVWTNRKNLHKGADGLYDTDHPLNAMWIKLKRAEYYGKPKHVEKRERQRKGIPETVKSIPVIKDTVKKNLRKKIQRKKQTGTIVKILQTLSSRLGKGTIPTINCWANLQGKKKSWPLKNRLRTSN